MKSVRSRATSQTCTPIFETNFLTNRNSQFIMRIACHRGIVASLLGILVMENVSMSVVHAFTLVVLPSSTPIFPNKRESVQWRGCQRLELLSLQQSTVPVSESTVTPIINDTITDTVMVTAATPNNLSLGRMAVAGSLATAFADVAMHPLDSVKTLQQSDIGIHMDAVSAFLYLWQSHSLYFGFLTYASADALGGALKFAFWESWKRQQVLPQLLGAALACIVSSVCIVPGEFFKQQLQMGNYDSLADAVQCTLLKDGFVGMYKGYDAILIRDIPYTILELSLYDWALKMLKCHPTIAAAITGAITAILTTPLDTVKTKIVVDYVNADTPSFLECFLHTVELYGPEGLFAGLLARVAWVVPFTVLYLPVYDGLKRFLCVHEQPQR